ncbi:MAG: hypothetical protein PHI50_00540 [Alphaproteobacteria bacterium]|nr:hypothetical protein [Alphaproteobacteria bacterium]
MKKLLLSTLFLMTASTMAMAAPGYYSNMTPDEMNPTNPFYAPKKGKGLVTFETAWMRYQDGTGENTYFETANPVFFSGSYGVTDDFSVVLKINDEEGRSSYHSMVTGKLASSPSVGVKYVSKMGKAMMAAEANYGFELSEGEYSESFDSVDGKVAVGFKEGDWTMAAFTKYIYMFDFRDSGSTNTRRMTGWYYGIDAQYQMNPYVSLDLGWIRGAKGKVAYRYTSTFKATNAVDTFHVGITYPVFDKKIYLTPYAEYHKFSSHMKEMTALYGGVKNASSYGIKVSMPF